MDDVVDSTVESIFESVEMTSLCTEFEDVEDACISSIHDVVIVGGSTIFELATSGLDVIAVDRSVSPWYEENIFVTVVSVPSRCLLSDMFIGCHSGVAYT